MSSVKSRLQVKTLILALSLGMPLVARAEDAPDLKRERRLFQNYQMFNLKPTAQEQWQEAISGVSEQSYQIQQGDTLWDISETFFGDTEFWPKIWSLNKEGIFNPHAIEPGDQIQFVPGTLGEAPNFGASPGETSGSGTSLGDARTTNEKDQPLTVRAGSGEDADRVAKESDAIRQKKPQFIEADLSNVELPTPFVKKSVRGAVNLPQSLPTWKMRVNADRQYQFEIRPVSRNPGASEITLLSYLSEENTNAIEGEIVEAEAGMHAAHDNQYVVVKAKGAAAGQKFLVIRDAGTLKAGERVGTIHQIDGEVTLQETVNASEGLYRAIVNRAYSPVLVGSKLSSGEVQRVVVDDAGVGGGGSDGAAKVLGGPESESREIFGPGQLLFLDAGASGGLAPGQTLNIYRRESSRTETETKQLENPRLIGTVRVLQTSPGFATAYVSSAIEAIHVGDSSSRGSQVK
ncbi:MAG: LysM peptidoglycan-binding domain-containing protein [Bdellovibrio sp.]|jgi:hypothetical protein